MIEFPNSKVPSTFDPKNTRYALVEDLVESLVLRYVKKYGMSDEDHQLARSCAFNVYMQAVRLYDESRGVPFAKYIAMRVSKRLIDWRIELIRQRQREITENRFSSEDSQYGMLSDTTAAPVQFMDILRQHVTDDALVVARVAVDPTNETIYESGGLWSVPQYDHKHRMELRTYFMLMGWSVSRVAAAFSELQEFLCDYTDQTDRTSRQPSHRSY